MIHYLLYLIWGCLLVNPSLSSAITDPPSALEGRLQAIAALAQSSPIIHIQEGWFLMGTIRKDDDPFDVKTQYDDTEFPQRRI